MCSHDYARLGYLMIYTGEEFCPKSSDNPEKHVRGAYKGYTNAADSIIVYQCRKCGHIKLSTGVFEKLDN